MAVASATIVAAVCSVTLIYVAQALKVSGVPVHIVPLQRNDADSPYCLVASTASFDDKINFLATQVWPSARLAAVSVQKYLNPSWTVCELGCGPGLPSLTAAKLGAAKVYATDLDEFALQLVDEGATQQGLDNVETIKLDLTATDTSLPVADLYLLSDVFESGHVARGSAILTDKALANGCRVWVFAQTDRVQREEFLQELSKLLGSDLSWSTVDDYDGSQALWLCDVDEGAVKYG